MSFPIRISARLRTRARHDHGLEAFDAIAEVVEDEDGRWARWSDDTARAFDRAFEGWTVERRLDRRWTEDAWAGFPARLRRGGVVITVHAEDRVEVTPAKALLDAAVIATLQGAVRGSALRGRRRVAAQREGEIIEAIRAYHAETDTRPTRDGIAQRMGHFSETEQTADSTFRRWVSDAGGWDRLVGEALG